MFGSICITLARCRRLRCFSHRFLAGWLRRCSQFFLPQAVGLARTPMLGSTAISRAVFPVRPPSTFLASLSPLEFDSRLSALVATEDLRGMTAH